MQFLDKSIISADISKVFRKVYLYLLKQIIEIFNRIYIFI